MKEVKGSALSDDQVVEALELIGSYDVVATVGVFDIGHHSVGQINDFRTGSCSSLRAGLTPKHSKAARAWVEAVCAELDKLPVQLVAQLYVLMLTIEEVVRIVPNYYAQRMPSELGRFDWVIDPKEPDRTTRYEKVWRQLVCPLLQANSLAEPMARVQSFDYSSFDRFLFSDIPEYLTPLVGGGSHALNLGMLLRESVSFPDSRTNYGLQIADVVASALTGSMNRRLPPRVWPFIGRLLIQPPRGLPAVRLLALGPSAESIRVGPAQAQVIDVLTQNCKPMFPA